VWISRVLVGFVLAASIDSAAAGDDPIPDNPLIAIPAGPFIFGSDDGNENERPRRVLVGRAFVMNRTEITNAQYQRFVDATGHRSAFYGGHPVLGLDDRPVRQRQHADAAEFCAYYGLRLPSERGV
jgi:iron(II)-dependent oxidoreductase